MADSRDPPPLFDEDDSRKDDENDIFASAVQSPISDGVTPEVEHINSNHSHPLLGDNEIEDTKKQPVENPSSSSPNVASTEESTNLFSHHDLFESSSQGGGSLEPNADLKTVVDIENTADQVREDFSTGPISEVGDGTNGGGLTNSLLCLEVSNGVSTKTESSILDSSCKPHLAEEDLNPINISDSLPTPLFLSDNDTTEVLLDDNAQEISLNDDDDGDLFTSAVGSKLNSNEPKSPPMPTSIFPPMGAAISPPQPSIFPTTYNAASAASISPTPITPVNSPPSLASERLNPLEQIEKEGDDTFIEILISDPQKIGDGMGSYMAYKVTTKTNVSFFRKRHWSVTRRFSDFLGLHGKLVDKHLHSGVIIPPAPEKAAIATTKIKLGSDKNSDSASVEFIERRRAALERYMNRTAAHPKLRADPDFREFIELDTDLPKATSTSAMSSAGVLRLFNRVGETVNKMTFKMEESDQWFEEKTLQVENLDTHLRKLHIAMEGLVGYRRELANSTGSFSKSAAVLSSVEEHTALSRALHQLSEAMERIHTIHHSQADADFFHLSETTKDYVNIIGAVKEVFHERVKMYQTWQHAQATLQRKRENKAKMELTGRIDKVELAVEEVREWESKVERSEEEFDRISKAIKGEMEQFDVSRVVDFKDMLVKYLEAIIASQMQIVKVWESFLPEAKAIALR